MCYTMYTCNILLTFACTTSSIVGFLRPFLAPVMVIFSTFLWQYLAYTSTGTCIQLSMYRYCSIQLKYHYVIWISRLISDQHLVHTDHTLALDGKGRQNYMCASYQVRCLDTYMTAKHYPIHIDIILCFLRSQSTPVTTRSCKLYMYQPTYPWSHVLLDTVLLKIRHKNA